ncbi:hypothetical protein AAHB37_17415 [Glutamicibacter halophytocola]
MATRTSTRVRLMSMPSPPGAVLAQGQRIQRAGAAGCDQDADDGAYQQRHDDAAVAALQVAHRPGAQLVEGFGANQRQRGAQPGEDRSHGHPGEHQPGGIHGTALGPADQVHQGRGQQGAGKGEEDVVVVLLDSEESDGNDDGQRGAGVHAEDPGLGQRVAGHRLREQAGDSQGRSGEDGQQGAWRP